MIDALNLSPVSDRANNKAGGCAVQRFTLDGDDALEQHLGQACRRVVSGIRGLIPPDRLEAVLLGGGYGRGEGGVLRTSGGDRPYNDIDFYVAVRGRRQMTEMRYGRALEALGHILTHLAGVEVEFKVTSFAELRSKPISMFSYDLFAGNRLLWGDPQLLAGCEHHIQVEQLPLSEATRLLMNRGTGLLLAREKLSAKTVSPDDVDFIRRNIAKAALACGDAVLAARGFYHWSCRERHRRLQRIARLEPSAWHEDLVAHHADGVEFKLRPHLTTLSQATLTDLHHEVTELARRCWLWVERHRLGCNFPSAQAYARSSIDKCPDCPRIKNLALNLWIVGCSLRGTPRPWRHPRERVYHALALLLWDSASTTDPIALAQLGRELATRMRKYPDMLEAYLAIWRRVQ